MIDDAGLNQLERYANRGHANYLDTLDLIKEIRQLRARIDDLNDMRIERENRWQAAVGQSLESYEEMIKPPQG